jgi:hypothetical protein
MASDLRRLAILVASIRQRSRRRNLRARMRGAAMMGRPSSATRARNPATVGWAMLVLALRLEGRN